MLKLRGRINPRNPYSKAYSSKQNSPRKGKAYQKSTNDKESRKWVELDRKQNEPGLIGILRQNQEIHEKIPDTPKKSLAEHLKRKALARFKILKDVKNKKEYDENRKRITEQVDREMDREFCKPSLDPSSKYFYL